MGTPSNLAGIVEGLSTDPVPLIDEGQISSIRTASAPKTPSQTQIAFGSRIPVAKSLSSRSRSISPNKPPASRSEPPGTLPKIKTAEEEYKSRSHRKDYSNAIRTGSSFRSKTSLSPGFALNFESPASKKFQSFRPSRLPTTSPSHVLAEGFLLASTKTSEPQHQAESPVDDMSNATLETVPEDPKDNRPVQSIGGEYEDSPMAKLMNEYGDEEDETTVSTCTKVGILAGHGPLKVQDIYNRGNEAQVGLRFAIELTLRKSSSETVNELQTFLEHAANLIDRSTYFRIDPHDTLMPILSGTQDINQLHAAWKAITKRVAAGDKFLGKYKEEYKKGSRLFSPASTDRELYASMERIETRDDRLRFMYAKFPRHHDALTAASQRAVESNHSWGMIERAEPEVLQAFSIANPNPRTSYGMGNDFLLPPEDAGTPNRPGKKGKKAPNDGREELLGLMGSATPYKAASKMFDEPGSTRNPLPDVQVGTTPAPNVLWGIGTPNPDAFAIWTPHERRNRASKEGTSWAAWGPSANEELTMPATSKPDNEGPIGGGQGLPFGRGPPSGRGSGPPGGGPPDGRGPSGTPGGGGPSRGGYSGAGRNPYSGYPGRGAPPPGGEPPAPPPGDGGGMTPRTTATT